MVSSTHSIVGALSGVTEKKNEAWLSAYYSDYRKANKARGAAHRAMYRASKHMATPPWANQERIALFYELARLESKRTGEFVEVDHIVPLQNPVVCGLHCEYNLQLISRNENRKKGNRVWPDMPI